MFVHPLRRATLPALVLSALAGGALADAPADCRDAALAAEARLAACATAIEAASDPIGKADLLDQRGRLLRLSGELDAAMADFEEARRLAPADADPLIGQGQVLHDRGDLAGAEALLDQAIALEPDYGRAYLAAMWNLGDSGGYERCLELAVRAEELAPERPHTWAYRGRCLAELGRTEEAVADYQRAAGMGFEEAFLHDNLSIALYNLGRAEEAVAAARHAVELDPGYESARISLIDALFATGAAEEAVAAYRESQALGIEDTLGLANQTAWGLYQAGRHEEALSVMEEWLAAHPEPTADQVYELDTYAHVLAALGRQEEAVAAFLRAAETGGPDKRAIYEAGLAELGFDPASGFEGALAACVATGAECRFES